MVPARVSNLIAPVALCAIAIACGDSSPSSPSSLPQTSLLAFTSQMGDWVGAGRTYRFTASDATFTNSGVAYSYPGSIVITVQTNDFQYWTVAMGAPAGQELQLGTYENARYWSAVVAPRPRFSLSGDGRACGESEGRFEIRTLTYRGTTRNSAGETVPLLERLHVLFAQRCSATSAPGLNGELVFIAQP